MVRLGIAALLACAASRAPVLAQEPAATRPASLKDVRSLYVGSFGSKPGAQALRERVTAEIGKLHRFHVVTDPAEADSVLAGTGEVWVKGHVTLNARNRGVMGDAQTLYSGYLSVEMKGKKEETLWSYLAAPHSVSSDVYRDLARAVVRKLADAIQAEPGK